FSLRTGWFGFWNAWLLFVIGMRIYQVTGDDETGEIEVKRDEELMEELGRIRQIRERATKEKKMQSADKEASRNTTGAMKSKQSASH
uniref:Uncharacterized protein n=3 Tax=Parascaris univalens TaxID=6257 RepID=A0A915C319_PARUN